MIARLTEKMKEAGVDAFVCGNFDLDSPFGVEAMVVAVYEAIAKATDDLSRLPRFLPHLLSGGATLSELMERLGLDSRDAFSRSHVSTTMRRLARRGQVIIERAGSRYAEPAYRLP